VSHGSSRGLSRGDRRRNQRLSLLRSVITRETVVVAFDLAADKQVCVVTDPDSRVLARRTWRCKAWQLDEAIAWAVGHAGRAGFGQVVVACEPTGHRWRVLDQLAAAAGLVLVCVQPLLVARAREGEDFTRNKNDDADAVIIARLVTELRCYLPERAGPVWARLRHLGARRARLVVAAGAARQQVRDLLECAWPAVLDAAAQPLDSVNWPAAVAEAVELAGPGGDLAAVAAGGFEGPDGFAARVRARLARAGVRWYSAIVRAVYDAATDPAHTRVGVAEQRGGALERVGFALIDLAHARDEITAVEARMLDVLDELGLTELAGSIPGVSAIGVAAILAETGDPTRFTSARALVKHAGLCPRDNASGTYQGTSRISGRGRPGLRLAAWRAVFTALQHNPVLAARYAHLTGRAEHPLTDTQARVAVAAALLRHLHAMITTSTPWNPLTASGHRPDHGREVSHAA
jgi:transposase